MGRPRKNPAVPKDKVSLTDSSPSSKTPTSKEESQENERKEKLRALKEELRAKNPDVKRISKAEAEAFERQKMELEKMVQGFRMFAGIGMEVVNELASSVSPKYFRNVPVSDSEKELLGQALSVYMERHAETLIDKLPGIMLSLSVLMFAGARVKIESFRKSNDPKNNSGNGDDRDREKQIDPQTPKAIPADDHP